MIRMLPISLVAIAILLSLASCKNIDKSETGTKATPEIKTSSPSSEEKNAARWKETTAKEFLKISDLKKKNPKEGIYETEGYIVGSVPVCDCPPEVDCDCDSPSITISEQNQPRKESRVLDGPREITIFTNPEGFKLGQKYRFKIEIPEKDSASEPIYYVDLVAYRFEQEVSAN
ncbi:MAG: hypothetical protein HKN25_15420 [Pyrinomonadaceae bacterium]|nr:hypothetical protein [Pyrinomonadaceae bacterium]